MTTDVGKAPLSQSELLATLDHSLFCTKFDQKLLLLFSPYNLEFYNELPLRTTHSYCSYITAPLNTV